MSLVNTEASFTSANILAVAVTTNAPLGGDHSSTSLEFTNEASTQWNLVVDGRRFEQPDAIRFELRGDTEAETMIDALEFAARSLREQMLLNRAGVKR